MTNLRKSWAELTTEDRRLHLLVDHRLMPERFGGQTRFNDVLTADEDGLLAMHALGHDDPYLDTARTHEHLPPVHPLSDDVPRDSLTIGASGEGWEWAYQLLHMLVQRTLCVTINDEPQPFELVAWIGDEEVITDPDGFITAKRWNEQTQAYDTPVTLRAFLDGGECAIRKVMVL